MCQKITSGCRQANLVQTESCGAPVCVNFINCSRCGRLWRLADGSPRLLAGWGHVLISRLHFCALLTNRKDGRYRRKRNEPKVVETQHTYYVCIAEVCTEQLEMRTFASFTLLLFHKCSPQSPQARAAQGVRGARGQQALPAPASSARRRARGSFPLLPVKPWPSVVFLGEVCP